MSEERFIPSEELTAKLLGAMTNVKRMSARRAHLAAKMDCIEGYHASKGQIGVNPRTYIGNRVMSAVGNLSTRAVLLHKCKIARL